MKKTQLYVDLIAFGKAIDYASVEFPAVVFHRVHPGSLAYPGLLALIL